MKHKILSDLTKVMMLATSNLETINIAPMNVFEKVGQKDEIILKINQELKE
jgi:hypothetical protein